MADREFHRDLRMQKVKADSPVTRFLAIAYRNVGLACLDSWRTTNAALQEALVLAIRRGFPFRRTDFARIASDFNFAYWGGASTNGNFAESYYTKAVEAGNRSAAIAFETWKRRKPLVYLGKRLAVDSTFPWWETLPPGAEDPAANRRIVEKEINAIHLTVTSFSADGTRIVACRRAKVCPKCKEHNPLYRDDCAKCGAAIYRETPVQVLRLSADDLKAMERQFPTLRRGKGKASDA